MIRVVFDANVIASRFPAKSGPLKLVLNLWTEGKVDLVISRHILEEVEKTWQKRYWREHFSEEDANDAFTSLDELSDMVWIRDWAPRVASHWHDDLVIAAAVEGEADYILTRDK